MDRKSFIKSLGLIAIAPVVLINSFKVKPQVTEPKPKTKWNGRKIPGDKRKYKQVQLCGTKAAEV